MRHPHRLCLAHWSDCWPAYVLHAILNSCCEMTFLLIQTLLLHSLLLIDRLLIGVSNLHHLSNTHGCRCTTSSVHYMSSSTITSLDFVKPPTGNLPWQAAVSDWCDCCTPGFQSHSHLQAGLASLAGTPQAVVSFLEQAHQASRSKVQFLTEPHCCCC